MTKTVNVFNFTGSYILTNLMPSTQYGIYVSAVRLIGVNKEILEGNSTMTVTATTLSEGIHYNYHYCLHKYKNYVASYIT